MKGFTLPELLITMSITAMIIGATIAVGVISLNSEELNRVKETVRNELITARSNSLSGYYDATWGVAFATGTITRFQGTSYAGRNTAFDMVETIGAGITISGSREIIFTRPAGFPQATGTIMMTDGKTTSTASINAFGAIEIN